MTSPESKTFLPLTIHRIQSPRPFTAFEQTAERTPGSPTSSRRGVYETSSCCFRTRSFSIFFHASVFSSFLPHHRQVFRTHSLYLSFDLCRADLVSFVQIHFSSLFHHIHWTRFLRSADHSVLSEHRPVDEPCGRDKLNWRIYKSRNEEQAPRQQLHSHGFRRKWHCLHMSSCSRPSSSQSRYPWENHA